MQFKVMQDPSLSLTTLIFFLFSSFCIIFFMRIWAVYSPAEESQAVYSPAEETSSSFISCW